MGDTLLGRKRVELPRPGLKRWMGRIETKIETKIEIEINRNHIYNINRFLYVIRINNEFIVLYLGGFTHTYFFPFFFHLGILIALNPSKLGN